MSVVKWGLIGAGDIARKRIAPAFRDLPNCEFFSVSRSRAELAEEFAREFGAKKWIADWREMLADPKIDAVYIATPVFVHAEQAIAAAEAGKHVLCEKPMALGVEECEWMIAACKANNVNLGIAYYRRFYPAVIRAKQVIDSGEIGSVSVAQINAFEYFNPPPEHPRRWFVEKAKSGGGPMMDFGCHRLEIMTNLFGKVRRVESMVSSDTFHREVEDTATALLQFESGTCASVTVTHASIEPHDTLHIFGTNGSIHVNSLNSGEMTIKTESGERLESLPPAANFHEPLISDFAEAIINNTDPEVSGEDGRVIATLTEKIGQLTVL